MDPNYLTALANQPQWLPGASQIFSAFSQALPNVRYVLFGESPYPRAQSANGYAFWDQAVDSLWSEQGLSKAVNRATSLRNFIKMLLLARGDLQNTDLSQTAIAHLDKSTLVQTGTELFQNLLHQGFLLLNVSLVLSAQPVVQDARAWRPFMIEILEQLALMRPAPTLILFGKVASQVEPFAASHLPRLSAEHPYNISFITHPEVLAFFKPFDLLAKKA
jgi:uracil-DNA glycosylase